MFKSFPVYGRKFAQLRERHGFTQDGLARATGRSKGTFARYELLDVAGISPRILADVERAFGMSRPALLAEIGVPANPSASSQQGADNLVTYWVTLFGQFVMHTPLSLQREIVEAVPADQIERLRALLPARSRPTPRIAKPTTPRRRSAG